MQLGPELCTGTEIIDTEEECKEAVSLLDLSSIYPSISTIIPYKTYTSVYPKGCYIGRYKGKYTVYWNIHPSGRESSHGNPICKKSE